MKYLFALSFIIVFAFFGTELGYTSTSAWHTHITYMFQHANIFHLVVNTLSFLFIWIELQKYMKQWLILPVFLIAFAVSFLPNAMLILPTVGISGAIYAMVGMFLIQLKLSKGLVIYISSVTIALVASYFMHNTNFYIHLYCLFVGTVYSFLLKVFS